MACSNHTAARPVGIKGLKLAAFFWHHKILILSFGYLVSKFCYSIWGGVEAGCMKAESVFIFCSAYRGHHL